MALPATTVHQPHPLQPVWQVGLHCCELLGRVAQIGVEMDVTDVQAGGLSSGTCASTIP
jgi:hypothetical protein